MCEACPTMIDHNAPRPKLVELSPDEIALILECIDERSYYLHGKYPEQDGWEPKEVERGRDALDALWGKFNTL